MHREPSPLWDFRLNDGRAATMRNRIDRVFPYHANTVGMKCVQGFFLLVILVLACGCTGTPPEIPATVQTIPDITATVSPAVPATGAVLAELSDVRPNATLALQPGTVLVSFRAEDAQKMTFSFTNGGDYAEMSEIVVTGPYTGTLAFGPPDAGGYQLNITGSGRWTATAALPDAAAHLAVPVNLSGSGTTVSPAFALEAGEYIFARNETGLSSPLYELRFANGSYLMDANNTCVQPCFGMDSGHPFTFFEIPESGDYFLSVLPRSSPHPWNVTISVVPAIPPLGPGPVILQTTQVQPDT